MECTGAVNNDNINFEKCGCDVYQQMAVVLLWLEEPILCCVSGGSAAALSL